MKFSHSWVLSQIPKQKFDSLFTEYTDDNALIPKNSSVIVRRIPIGGVKSTSKTYVMWVFIKAYAFTEVDFFKKGFKIFI